MNICDPTYMPGTIRSALLRIFLGGIENWKIGVEEEEEEKEEEEVKEGKKDERGVEER